MLDPEGSPLAAVSQEAVFYISAFVSFSIFFFFSPDKFLNPILYGLLYLEMLRIEMQKTKFLLGFFFFFFWVLVNLLSK